MRFPRIINKVGQPDCQEMFQTTPQESIPRLLLKIKPSRKTSTPLRLNMREKFRFFDFTMCDEVKRIRQQTILESDLELVDIAP